MWWERQGSFVIEEWFSENKSNIAQSQVISSFYIFLFYWLLFWQKSIAKWHKFLSDCGTKSRGYSISRINTHLNSCLQIIFAFIHIMNKCKFFWGGLLWRISWYLLLQFGWKCVRRYVAVSNESNFRILTLIEFGSSLAVISRFSLERRLLKNEISKGYYKAMLSFCRSSINGYNIFICFKGKKGQDIVAKVKNYFLFFKK